MPTPDAQSLPEQTPTPKTDDARHRYWMGGYWSEKFCEFTEDLERQLAEKDREWEIAARDAGLYRGTLTVAANALGCEECMVEHAVADLLKRLAAATADKETAEKDAAFVRAMLDGFEWQRINSMHIAEVEQELRDAGYTKERLDAGLSKVRAMVEAALSARQSSTTPTTEGQR